MLNPNPVIWICDTMFDAKYSRFKIEFLDPKNLEKHIWYVSFGVVYPWEFNFQVKAKMCFSCFVFEDFKFGVGIYWYVPQNWTY